MRERWSNAAHVAAVAAWLAIPGILGAQVDMTAATDSGSCVARIPPDEMTRVGVHLMVEVVIPADSTRMLALPPALMLSGAVAQHMREFLGASNGAPPPGEPVVTWRDSDGTLRMTIHRGGTMSVSQRDGKPLRFTGGRGLFATALNAAVQAGERFAWPSGVSTDSIVVEIELESESAERGTEARPRPAAKQPVFTVMKPWLEPAHQIRSPRIRYPAAVPVDRVQGAVHLTFVVDTAGHAEPDTVRDEWPTGTPRLTGAKGRYYEAFVKAVRRGLGTARYAPARLGGCPVKIRVAQRFEFEPATGTFPPP